MQVSIIVAAARNGVIGKDNQLIWRLPDDLKRFKALTIGHPVIMGRKTFDSIGKPLPGRQSIVITRNRDFQFEGVIVVHSLAEALDAARATGTDETFVIGGGTIYEEALDQADKIYLTAVNAAVEGDTWFWLDNPEKWQKIGETSHSADEKHSYAFTFIDYIRK